MLYLVHRARSPQDGHPAPDIAGRALQDRPGPDGDGPEAASLLEEARCASLPLLNDSHPSR